MTTRYRVEIVLYNGLTVTQDATEEQADELLNSRAFVFRRNDMAPEEKHVGAVQTLLAQRIEKQSGFWVMTDNDGKEWLIPARSIIAANVRDLQRPSGRRAAIGFGPAKLDDE